MAPHSSTLAWKIPWTEEPGGLLSIGPHRVGNDWSNLASMHALEKEMATHFSNLAWRIPGMEEPGGLPSMGSHRVGHDWSDLAAAAQESVERNEEDKRDCSCGKFWCKRQGKDEKIAGRGEQDQEIVLRWEKPQHVCLLVAMILWRVKNTRELENCWSVSLSRQAWQDLV